MKRPFSAQSFVQRTSAMRRRLKRPLSAQSHMRQASSPHSDSRSPASATAQERPRIPSSQGNTRSTNNQDASPWRCQSPASEEHEHHGAFTWLGSSTCSERPQSAMSRYSVDVIMEREATRHSELSHARRRDRTLHMKTKKREEEMSRETM
jgi:hypothetical protein